MTCDHSKAQLALGSIIRCGCGKLYGHMIADHVRLWLACADLSRKAVDDRAREIAKLH